MLLRKLLLFTVLAVVSESSAASLFEDDSALEVSLSGPLSSLLEDKASSRELPFVLRAGDVEHAVKVRVRGKSRRRLCGFPPLRINFAIDDTAQSIFHGQDKLKLVTHCGEKDAARLDILQEYAAYRIFNLISEFSYRVRLLDVTYKDTEGAPDESTVNAYGFLVESSSGLADRIGGQPAHLPGVSLRSLDSRQTAAMFIFQYLIGNTDWSLVMADEDDRCCHNSDVFDSGSVRYVVPYDFDLSGLVNAGYARPDPSLRISKVTRRLYRGYCMPTDALQNALDDIKARKADILNVPGELPGLSEKEIKRMTSYIEDFFVQAEDTGKMLKLFERKCL